MNAVTAHFGMEVIDSWHRLWGFEMPDEALTKMLRFGLDLPKAALVRWTILAGSCPWYPSREEAEKLRSNPRYCILDSMEEQQRLKQNS